MLIRHALFVLVACAVPAVASAWTINASSSSGGTINPRGYITVSGTSGTSKSFAVKPSSGYRVAQVSIDSIPQSLPVPDGSGVYTYTVTYNGVFNRNVYASFVAQTYRLTLTAESAAGANGWVTATTTPAGLPLAKLPPGTPVQCVVTAAAGSEIDSVKLNGLPQSVTAPGQLTLNLVISQDTTVAAKFRIKPQVTVNAGPDLTADGNGPAWPVSLNGSAGTNTGTPLAYNWSVVQGPAGGVGVFGSPNMATTTFSAVTPGTYTVKLTAIDGLGTTGEDAAVVTVPWRSALLSDYCISCHNSRDPVIVGQHTASKHRTSGSEYAASCQACHNRPGEEYKHYAFSRPTDACQPCHSNVSSRIVIDYLASPHPAQGIGCTSCHYDHSLPKTYSVCLGCHKTGGVASTPPAIYHTAEILGDLTSCNGCHNPHLGAGAPANHFNNITTGSYPAQYVTANIVCGRCHTAFTTDMTIQNKAVRNQWAKTAKADVNAPAWTEYDFKTMGTAGATPATSYAARDCVRCHTATGYVNYVTDAVGDGFSAFRDIAPWGGANDKAKEVLACSACHVSADDPAKTFDSLNSRRVVGNFIVGANAQAWYSYSSAGGKSRIAKTFNDQGESNICIPCHSGRTAGNNIKKLPLGFNWGSVDFINPHYMAVAGVMFPGFGTTTAERSMTIGYEFPGALYSNAGAHAGLDQSNGPCIQCHMAYSPDKHRFSAVSTASNGVIQRITSTRCADCHGTGATIVLDAGSKLEVKRQRYLAALALIDELFRTNKGIYFKGDTYPYFFTDGTYAAKVTNWGDANTMGAAFNLKLFQSERGAYVHNALHVQQLLYDTADFLDGGQSGSVSTTIQNSGLEQTVKEAAQSYIGTRWTAVPPSP